MNSNIVTAVFGEFREVSTRALYKWDYGQILRFEGLDLPDNYIVHFSNENVGGESVTMIGNADGVDIPNECLTTGKPVYAWVFLNAGADDGETVYSVIIPVKKRPRPCGDEPTPVQQGAIEQAIAALNTGVAAAQEAAQDAEQIASDLGDFDTAMRAVTAAKEEAADSATNASTAAGEAADSAAEAAQTLANVRTEGAAQISAIDAEGQEVLDSIPQDYSELSADVVELKSQISEIIDTTSETVVPEFDIFNGYVKSDGTVTGSGTTWECSDYVDISSASKNKVTVNSCIYGAASTVWFDANQNVIGYINGANASDYGLESKSEYQNYELTLPSSAKYIRISAYKSSYDAPVNLSIQYTVENAQPGELLAEILSYKADVTVVDGILNSLDDLLGDPGGTVEADVTIVDDTMILENGTGTASDHWESSGYVDVSDAQNHQVTIKSTVYGYAATVWYDSSKNVLNGFNGNNCSEYGITASSTWQTYSITLPNNAAFIRISGYKDTKSQGDALSVSYVLDAVPGTLDVELSEKVDIQQGVSEAGKVLAVDNNGEVTPVSAPWQTDLAAKADKTDVDMLESIVGDPEYMNLVDPSTIVENTYINGSTGVRTSSTYYKSSDYMLLKAKTLYYVGGFYISESAPLNYMAFYSMPSEDDFISVPDITLTRSANDHATILVGSTDVYVRLSAVKAKTGMYVSAYVDYYVAYSGPITLKEMVTPKCRFKKILVLGDSISTDNYGDYKKWVTDLIDEGFFPSDVVNSSQHASGFVARYNDQPNDFITRLTSIQNPETYDLVITFGGINDANQLVPMGTDSDTDYTTYFGAAVRYYYQYLCLNFINARIATLLPLPCSTQNRDPSVIGVQYTYSDYQKSVCESYSLPVLDLTNRGGFYPDANRPGINYNAAQAFRNRWTLQVGDYNPDGIHPTEEYEKKFLAPMIKAFIETL